VSLSGGDIVVTGLTVGQMEAVKKLSGAAQNVLAIAFATGEDHDGVKEWYHSDTTAASDVGRITDAIARLSGLDEGAQFPRGTNDDAVAQRPGT
jgi:hypothetical protein